MDGTKGEGEGKKKERDKLKNRYRLLRNKEHIDRIQATGTYYVLLYLHCGEPQGFLLSWGVSFGSLFVRALLHQPASAASVASFQVSQNSCCSSSTIPVNTFHFFSFYALPSPSSLYSSPSLTLSPALPSPPRHQLERYQRSKLLGLFSKVKPRTPSLPY